MLALGFGRPREHPAQAGIALERGERPIERGTVSLVAPVAQEPRQLALIHGHLPWDRLRSSASSISFPRGSPSGLALEVRRDGLHLVQPQVLRDPVHDRDIAHVALERSELLEDVL